MKRKLPEIALHDLILENLNEVKKLSTWPKVYKVASNSLEYATQADIDTMEAEVQAYGRLSEFFKKNHRELGEKLGWPEAAKK